MADISVAVHQCEVCAHVAQWRFVAPGVMPGEVYQKYACYWHFGHVEEAVDADLRSRAVATEPQIDLWDQGFPLDEQPILEDRGNSRPAGREQPAEKVGDCLGDCGKPGCSCVQGR